MSSDLFFNTSLDDEDEVNSELAMFTEACQAAYEASKPKVHRTSVQRDRYGAYDRLVMAYFSEHPHIDEVYFRKSSIGNGCVPDSLDEYLQMGATTVHKCLKNFCKVIMNLYGEEFLRKPTYTDIEKLYAYHNEKHEFPGMLGSIDCTNWLWANCPHAFFGVSGMNNNVNILRQSPLFNDLKSGRAPDVPFMANNVPYKRGYYLTDGIYPQWSVLIKLIKNPGTNDHKLILYKTKHETARKDVERAFGVLKQKLKIIKYAARGLTREEQHCDDDPVRTHQESMQVTQEIIDRTAHLSLKADLVEHI
uniref:Protein ALP1-like n=1 Tax=Tanacetum cinerariifolium TaxID=118510 RepID=A0A699HAV7_TANCI|nr:hypothetical protein [Tanacetum cinerariifolium]